MIPQARSYKQHLGEWERQMKRIGLGHTHGARHLYAQSRFQELTGFACPLRGGPLKRDMNAADRQINIEARRIISRELGHNRLDVTIRYLGSWSG